MSARQLLQANGQKKFSLLREQRTQNFPMREGLTLAAWLATVPSGRTLSASEYREHVLYISQHLKFLMDFYCSRWFRGWKLRVSYAAPHTIFLP